MASTGTIWHKHQDDPTASIPPASWSTACDGASTQEMVSKLRAQGYIVYRAVVEEVCVLCDGDGKVSIRPKHAKRSAFEKLPAWAKEWKACPLCDGTGYESTRELTV